MSINCMVHIMLTKDGDMFPSESGTALATVINVKCTIHLACHLKITGLMTIVLVSQYL